MALHSHVFQMERDLITLNHLPSDHDGRLLAAQYPSVLHCGIITCSPRALVCACVCVCMQLMLDR